MKDKKNTSKIGNIQKKLFWLQFVLILTMAILLGVSGTIANIHFEKEKRDENLKNIAETIALSPLLADIELDETEKFILTEYLDALKDTLSDIDVISVVGKDNIRIYHSNASLIGKEFDGTIPDFQNGGYYVINEKGTSGEQRRAYAAIYDKDGKQVGFVMAIMLMSNIQQEIVRILWVFIPITLAVIVVELLISMRFSYSIKKGLLGFEPDVFSAMYKIRDNILESLDEGIIAVDKENRVQFINQPAISMLGESVEYFDVHAPLDRDNIILDNVPIKENEKVIGSICIMHDRAEYTRLMEDLTGTKYLVDSMRANNHDFTNKLHVILGLIQMEMYEEAETYIQNISMVQKQTIGRIMKVAKEPALAALLIGKSARASELNVKFIIREGAVYEKNVYPMPTETLITIVGNLIDNALDSMNDCKNETKELLFGIYSHHDTLLITVDDTGCGIEEKDIEKIFENGYSTKGNGRGTGLFVIKNIIENMGGKISVESQKGVGTSFSVSFTKNNKGDKNV